MTIPMIFFLSGGLMGCVASPERSKAGPSAGKLTGQQTVIAPSGNAKTREVASTGAVQASHRTLETQALRASSTKPRTTQVVLSGRLGDARVFAELATTSAERTRGLMHREELPEGHGMLFVFPERANHRFWMKNTPLSLDMIFIDALPGGGSAFQVVGLVHGAEPFSSKQRGVDKPSTHVLEVPGGWSKARGIRAGDRVTIVVPKVP